MKHFTFNFKWLVMSLLLCIGSSALGQSDKSAVYTSNVTLTAGNNSSDCTVNEHPGVKCGTSKKTGSVSFTVPSGTKYLHIHVAAWSGESTTTISITPTGNGVPASISLTADTGIFGSSTDFTLNGTESSTDFYKVITFTDALASNTNYTISSSKRFAIWGVNSENAAVAITSIAFSEPKTASVGVGGTTTLSPTVLPANHTEVVDWVSDATDVATVNSSGVVTGVAAGTAHITAKAHDNPSTIYDVCTVTVASPVATEVAITDPGTLAKDATGTFAYTATTEEDNTASWTSATTGVITITNAATGAYTAAGRGTSKITLTLTPTDATTYGAVTAERTVTVTEPVLISASDKGMTVGDTPIAIGATTTEGYVGTLTYESGNKAIATVDEGGNITAVAKGTTTITISAPADETHYFTAGDVVINVTVKGLAELAYATPLYNVAYGTLFPTPELTNPHGLAITYSKTGDNVATVDPSTGAVTILSGTKGTARITASTEGDAEYAPGSAYYDIKVYDPSEIEINFNNNDQNVSGNFVQDNTLSYTINGIKLDFSIGTATSNAPRVDGASYSSTKYARIYTDNTLTITGVNNAIIKSIEFDFNKGSLTNSTNTYSSSNTTWTGKSHSVTFTGAATTFINSITISYESESVTFSSNGYTTFASPLPLDLTAANLPTGVSAYKASVEGTTVTFTEIDQTVPANTGILLKGTANETVAIPVAASGTAVADNAFEVNAAGATFTGDGDYYYFGLKKNTLTFALFEPSAVAIPANKAYLKVLKSSIPASAKSLNVVFDETTGISTLERIVIDNDAWYDLQGRRVAQPTKGIYIHNGKKIFVK